MDSPEDGQRALRTTAGEEAAPRPIEVFEPTPPDA